MDGKQAAGEKAAEAVKDGMIVGLGTGSTVYWTILKLAELMKGGLTFRGVPTSEQTEKLAISLNIPLVDLAEIDEVDLTIDGADEVNPDLNLIKGGGGALLREKMVASVSRRLVIVADESKYVNRLGQFPLPVEVVKFGSDITKKQIEDRYHCHALLRVKDGAPFITDNGNYILDCHFGEIFDPKEVNLTLNQLPGVVENGLFTSMADTVIIASPDGTIRILGDALNRD